METNQAVFAEKQQCRKAKESESERCKKGEWSDGAIFSLLEAYEMKWNKRNRGNLRVGDWEEVSVLVSSRCEGSKPAKTSTQCKNKIEGMKKRYRLEALDSCNVNRNGCSSWPFFSRMDGLLRSPNRMMMAGIPGGLDSGGLGLGLGFSELVENGHSNQAPLRADDDGTGAMLCPDDGHIQRHVPFSHLQLLQGDGDLRGRAFFPEEEEEEDDEEGEDMQEAESKHEGISQTLLQRKENSETSAHGCKPAATPLTAAAVAAADVPMATRKPCAKQKKHIHNEVAASIRTFAESILKLEHAKMEMYKDAERLRAEAEARRADLELRRTEMIMNTQLEIAKLLSCNSINDSKKKMTKKKKKKKVPKAPFKNGVLAIGAGLLQTVSQQTQHVEAIPFSQSVSGNEY